MNWTVIDIFQTNLLWLSNPQYVKMSMNSPYRVTYHRANTTHQVTGSIYGSTIFMLYTIYKQINTCIMYVMKHLYIIPEARLRCPIMGCLWWFETLRWRHNDHTGVSNHQPHGCLLNRLFRRRSKKTSKLRVTGLCAGNSPGPVNSPHKGPVTRKMFPFDDVIMKWIRQCVVSTLHPIPF